MSGKPLAVAAALGPECGGCWTAALLVRPTFPKYHVEWNNAAILEKAMRIIAVLFVVFLASPLLGRRAESPP